jgi:hypothetical protein
VQRLHRPALFRETAGGCEQFGLGLSVGDLPDSIMAITASTTPPVSQSFATPTTLADGPCPGGPIWRPVGSGEDFRYSSGVTVQEPCLGALLAAHVVDRGLIRLQIVAASARSHA